MQRAAVRIPGADYRFTPAIHALVEDLRQGGGSADTPSCDLTDPASGRLLQPGSGFVRPRVPRAAQSNLGVSMGTGVVSTGTNDVNTLREAFEDTRNKDPPRRRSGCQRLPRPSF